MTAQPVNAEIPADYLICTSESCSERTNCLHARVAAELIRTAATLRQINPHHPNYHEGSQCRFFRSAQPECYARGFRQAMNQLTRQNYVAMTNHLRATISTPQFYRMKRGDIPLSPDMQAEMEKTFQAYGLEGKLTFDSYEQRFTWY